MEAIQTAVSTAFQSVQTNVSSMITTCAPYALGIIGTVMAVTIGIKVFKTLTAQAYAVGCNSYHNKKGKGIDALTLLILLL